MVTRREAIVRVQPRGPVRPQPVTVRHTSARRAASLVSLMCMVLLAWSPSGAVAGAAPHMGGSCRPPLTGGVYVPLAPQRVVDTRSGLGGVAAPLAAGGSVDFSMLGVGGIPVAGVTAIAVNITATAASAAGFLTVHPAGSARPLASTLNYASGHDVANLVVVPTGDEGRITVFSSASTHVVIDVVGWYGPAMITPGSFFVPAPPARLLDTRNGVGHAGRAVDGSSFEVQVAGRGGVPASGVTAVVLNVTVTGPAAPGFLTVFPGGSPLPATSSLNYRAGATVAGAVTAQVGADGTVAFAAAGGAPHVIADVVGWYTVSQLNATSLVPLPSNRILDTRNAQPLGPHETLHLAVPGAPVGSTDSVAAVVVNVTVTGPSSAGFLSVGQLEGNEASTSSLNFAAGDTVANLVVARVDAGGTVSIHNSDGRTHVIVDLVGWFASPVLPIECPFSVPSG